MRGFVSLSLAVALVAVGLTSLAMACPLAVQGYSSGCVEQVYAAPLAPVLAPAYSAPVQQFVAPPVQTYVQPQAVVAYAPPVQRVVQPQVAYYSQPAAVLAVKGKHRAQVQAVTSVDTRRVILPRLPRNRAALPVRQVVRTQNVVVPGY